LTLPAEDGTWGKMDKKVRFKYIQILLSHYHGEKWWSGDYPTTDEWSAFLYGEEGSILNSHSDKTLLVQILLYTINHAGADGPYGYTPTTNPIIDPWSEKMNFTKEDWNALIHPDADLLKEGFDLVNEVSSSLGYDINSKPDYLYTVTDIEIATAQQFYDDHHMNVDLAFDSSVSHKAFTSNGYLLFLARYEDFRKVFPK
jgi:hypothetical protein